MFVGDGTWDTERNTFLLPNLVGLNFNTMRYNGGFTFPNAFVQEIDDGIQAWEIDSEN